MPKIYIINYQPHTIQTSVQKWTLCSFLCTKKNQHPQNLYSHLKLYNKKMVTRQKHYFPSYHHL